MAEERLKDAVRKATQEVNWAVVVGSISAQCRKKIQDMVTPGVNRRSVLRYFIKTSQRANKRQHQTYQQAFPVHSLRKACYPSGQDCHQHRPSGSVSDACLQLSLLNLTVLQL